MLFRIDLKIFLFLILFLFTNQIEMYVVVIFFCIIHELGHLLAGLLLGMKPKKIELMPLGLTVSFELKPKDYNKKIRNGNLLELKKFFVALAGPLTNLIFVIYFISTNELVKYEMPIYANILIGLLNLLPIYPLDGGRMLKSVLHILIGNKKAKQIVNKTANIIMAFLTAVSSIAILYFENIAIFLAITYLWILTINENKRYQINMKIYKVIEEHELEAKCQMAEVIEEKLPKIL